MDAGYVVLLLIPAAGVAWFVRDRHIKGWRRPLWRARTYNATAAATGDGAKGYTGQAPGGGVGPGF